MSIRRSLALFAVPAATLALSLTVTPALGSTASAASTTSAPHAAPSGTEIAVADTAFGPSLAVGSGPFKGFTLYYLTADHGHSFGCTTGVTKTPVGPFTCTGPSNDKNAEWPAITTTGKPVAGPGVSQALLGRVFRKGVGWQVTYAGHPLYLFDQQPGAVTGDGWDETGLPPWHGVWWLMSPGGHPVSWAGTLTTAQVSGHTVLAEPMETGIGWVNFPLYTFSGDLACADNSACARAWPVAYTDGSPGFSGVPASGVGTVGLPGGLSQITWNGHPLYLFSNEAIAPNASGGVGPVGSGNGIKAFGGTFSLVVNP